MYPHTKSKKINCWTNINLKYKKESSLVSSCLSFPPGYNKHRLLSSSLFFFWLYQTLDLKFFKKLSFFPGYSELRWNQWDSIKQDLFFQIHISFCIVKKLSNCNVKNDRLLVLANHIDNKQSLLYLMSLYQPSLTAFLSFFSNHILFNHRKKLGNTIKDL
jgi:hypothetical protein